MSIQCCVTDPKNISEFWPRVAPFVELSLAYEGGDLSMRKIYDYVEQGIFLMVVVFDTTDKNHYKMLAVQTMEIIKTPHGKLCNLVTTGGTDLDVWQDKLAAVIDTLAKNENCYAIHTRGRPGWLRQLKRNGYEPLYFIAEKKLTIDKGAENVDQ